MKKTKTFNPPLSTPANIENIINWGYKKRTVSLSTLPEGWRRFTHPLFLFLFCLARLPVLGQIPNCESNVPTFVVDFAQNLGTTFITPPLYREGHCCGQTGSDECLNFEMTLDSNNAGVSFEIVEGAEPSGNMYYQIDCSSPISITEIGCVSSPGIHYVTFCKPGSNLNRYALTSVPRPTFRDDTVAVGCWDTLSVFGLKDSMAQYTSISPGAIGQYNNLLSCSTGCAKVRFTPTSSSPSLIQYRVCGFALASNCVGTQYYCDTITVHVSPDWNTTPDQFICAPATSAMLGSAPPGTKWRIVAGNPSPATIDSLTGQVNGILLEGNYYFVLQTQSQNCKDTITIIKGSKPNAGIDQTLCKPQTTTSLGIAPAGFSWSAIPGNPSPATVSASSGNVSGLNNPGFYAFRLAAPSGCSDTVLIWLKEQPSTPAAGSNSPVCSGNTLQFNTTADTGVIFLWSGPNGFSSSLQNPSKTNATSADAGLYTCSVQKNGCWSVADSVLVIVNQTPTQPLIISNSPICSGQTLTLSTTAVPGAIYQWSGPNGYTGTGQNLNRTNADTSYSGNYQLTISVLNCPSPAATTLVQVKPTPSSALAGSNSPVCSGQTIQLTASFISGVSYLWTGPSGFSSTLQNPTIVSSTLSAGGTYQVITTLNGCSSSAVSVSVVVKTTPTAPILSSNGIRCAGDTLKLFSSFLSGVTYQWTGPSGFSSTAQNPFIVNASPVNSGTYSCTVNLNGCINTESASIQGTVNSCPPVAINDSYQTPENQTLVVTAGNGLIQNDFDPATPPQSITISTTAITSPQHGVVNLSTNGAFSYVPQSNYNGADTFSYRVCDTESPIRCDTGFVFIQVIPVNDPPVVNNLNTTTSEDQTITICLPISDIESEQLHLATICQIPAHGTINNPVVSNTGFPHQVCFTYTPGLNYNGLDSICLVVCDNGQPNLCDTAKIRISVTPVNDAPVVQNDYYTVSQDTAITRNITNNDTDPDGPGVHIQLSCGTTYGTVTLSPNGTFTYTPPVNFGLTDSFCYTYCDSGNPNLCDVGIVYLDYTGSNLSPLAQNDYFTTPEDQSINGNVLSNDTDPNNGSTLTVNSVLIQNVQHGIVSMGTNGQFTYNPNPQYFGTDTFRYRVCDNGLPVKCDTAYVFINVTPVNDPPVVSDTTLLTSEDVPLSFCMPVLDIETADLHFTLIQQLPSHGQLISYSNDNVSSPHRFCGEYINTLHYNGTDSIRILVCDNGVPGKCDSAVIRIIIQPVNDAPQANPDFYTGTEDNNISGNVIANDTDPDGPAIQITSVVCSAQQGIVTISPTGSFIYQPNENYYGTDSFCYRLCDQGNPERCDTGYVSLTLNPVNDAPVVQDTTITITEGQTLEACIPITDPDISDLHTAGLCSTPGLGSFFLSGVQNTTSPHLLCFTYSPPVDYAGNQTVCMVVCDNGIPGKCDTTNVQIVILPVNDPPQADTVFVATYTNQPAGINVSSTCGDPEGHPLTFSYGAATVAGVYLNINGAGNIILQPPLNFTGIFSIPYQVCDSSPYLPFSLCDESIILVQVYPTGDTLINHSPIASTDYANIPMGASAIINVLGNDFDPDGDYLQTSLSSGSSIASVSLNSSGQLSYIPQPGFTGTDTLSYSVCDPFGFTQPRPLCSSAQVIIYVTADSAGTINDPPVAVADILEICSDAQAFFSPLSNDSDPNGNNIGTPNIIVNPSHGTLNLPGAGIYQYDPEDGFSGVDSIGYSICDAGTPSRCDTGWMIITVSPNPSLFTSDTSIVICSGDSLHIPFAVSPAGSIVQWTSSEGQNGTGDIHTLMTNNTTLPKNIEFIVRAVSPRGCGQSPTRIVVSVLPRPTISSSSMTNTVCSGDAISILLNADIPGTQFNWWSTGGISGTGNVIYDLPQNTSNTTAPVTYLITALSNGCFGDTLLQSVLVKPLPQILLSTQPSMLCSGSEVNVQLNSSIPGTIYFWSSTSGLFGSSPLITDYPVNVSNGFPITVSYLVNSVANGCNGNPVFTSVTVWPQPLADAGLDKIMLSCGTNVTIIGGSPVASGGTSPYTYAWSPTQGLNDSTLPQPMVSSGFSPTYILTITDVHGCTASDAVNVSMINSGLMAEAGLGGSICSNSTDSVLLGGTPTAVGGDPVYTYTWSPATGLNLNNVANPSARPDSTTHYILTITDENGCTAQDSVLVIVKPAPVANAGKDTLVCLQSTLTIGGFPAASGGSGNGYQYSWSPVVGVVIPAIPNPMVTPTGTTTYSLTVTDINGCIATDDVLVQTLTDPTADAGQDKTLFNCSQSSIFIGGTPSGTGNGFLTYEWSPSVGLNDSTLANPQVSGLNTSTLYTLTVRSGRTGCAKTDQVLVTVENSSLSVEAGPNHLLCPEANQGVSLGGMPTVTGGSPPYQFTWSPSAGLSDSAGANPVATPQNSTTYYLSVTDHNGCLATDSVHVSIPGITTFEFPGLNTSYCADASGVPLFAEPQGGVFSGPGVTGLTFNPSQLEAGTWCISYIYTTPNTNCVQDTSVCIRIDSVPHLVVSGLQSSYCQNDLPVFLTAEPQGGAFSGLGIEDNIFTPGVVPVGEADIYYTYSDRMTGCSNDIRISTYIKSTPSLTAFSSATEICPGENIYLFAQYSLDVLNIQWADLEGNILYSGLNNVPVTPNANSSCYIASAQNTEGCRNTDTACVQLLNCSIQANDEPCEADSTEMNTAILIPVLANDILPEGRDTTIQISGQVINGKAVVLENLQIEFTPYTNVSGFGSFEYVVCVDTNGSRICDTAFVCVVITDPTIYCRFPNTITPNEDGINDWFEISCNDDYPSATMRIYTRWGSEVYRSEGHYNNRWNGQNQEGETLTDGTYFYIYRLNDGTDRIEKGFIDIYR